MSEQKWFKGEIKVFEPINLKESPFTLIDEAKRLLKYHLYKEAFECIQKALTYKKYGFVYCCLADYYYRLEMYNESLEACYKAMEVEKENGWEGYYPYPNKKIALIKRKLERTKKVSI